MKLIPFIALLLPFAWGCKKKTTGSNDNSSSYANSFTCEVNGQSWIAQTPDNPNGPAAITAEFYEPSKGINIFGIVKIPSEGKFQKIAISAVNIDSLGTHEMYYQALQTYGFVDYYPVNCDIFYYDSGYQATMNITEFNPNKHRISGSFQMTLHNPDCPDSIMTITNGHFSTYYQ